MSCIILKETWSVVSKIFLLSCFFHYISNSSKVLEFYLTSFFNVKSWRVKFRNFLDNFPVHFVALFINRTINNNYMTLLMALHHTHDGFWYFFQMIQEQPSFLTPGTLSTLNLPIKSYPSSGQLRFPWRKFSVKLS